MDLVLDHKANFSKFQKMEIILKSLITTELNLKLVATAVRDPGKF